MTKFIYILKDTPNVKREEAKTGEILFGRRFNVVNDFGSKILGTVTLPFGAWGMESIPFLVDRDDLEIYEDRSATLF